MKKLILIWLLFVTLTTKAQTTKILYVDNFDKICGNKIQEDSLFSFATHIGFNSFYLYNLNSVTQNNAGKTSLGLFIARSHVSGIKCIGIAGSVSYITSSAINSRKSYQDWQIDPNKRLDGINVEAEFWRYPKSGTCTFPDWVNIITANTVYCTSTDIQSDFYIGQLNDKQGVYSDSKV